MLRREVAMEPQAAEPEAREIRAVLFDFGGVILSSPIDAFRVYERAQGLPAGFLQRLNMSDPDRNAWACMERGEIDEETFHARFQAEGRALEIGRAACRERG